VGGRGVWMHWESGKLRRLFSPVINVFLQLHVYCICYISVDYRTERLCHSITVVQIHVNVFMKE
jgi:hypothetical protein